MPATLSYPGVYVEEIPSGVRTITGVATSITAFFGRAQRGPTDTAVTINSYGDFERIFGGLWRESSLGYAVRDFYLNGGSQAIVVRLFHAPGGANPPPANAVITLGSITLDAAYPGTWGQNLRAAIDVDVSEAAAQKLGVAVTDLFNLTVTDTSPGGTTEVFRNVSLKPCARRIDNVLRSESHLVTWHGDPPAADAAFPQLAAAHTARQQLQTALKANPRVPANVTAAQQAVDAAAANLVDNVSKAAKGAASAQSDLDRANRDLAAAQAVNPPVQADIDAAKAKVDAAKTALQTAQTAVTTAQNATGGSDGDGLTIADFHLDDGEPDKIGLYALEQADLFNLLCIAPYLPSDDVDVALVSAAAAYCERRRAMLLVDSPSSWVDKTAARNQMNDPSQDNVGTRSRNAALFFPRLRQPDPLNDNQMNDFVPCGAVAGIFARTDAQRGVWKAPAGLDATLVGVPQLAVNLTDPEHGELNPLGVNCLRVRPAAGRVVWGSRTLEGDDRLASEWKYIPVRRTALFIEESLYRGTQWVVFEPNDEPLWAQIRLNIGAFMQNLFRQGAFQGTTPREAYFVKCDKETTLQNHINLGIVNIVVGFAPLKPAEFVVLQIQQMAGQIAT